LQREGDEARRIDQLAGASRPDAHVGYGRTRCHRGVGTYALMALTADCVSGPKYCARPLPSGPTRNIMTPLSRHEAGHAIIAKRQVMLPSGCATATCCCATIGSAKMALAAINTRTQMLRCMRMVSPFSRRKA
jgi:hypothetical protein